MADTETRPRQPWLPYVAPFAAFILLLALQGRLPVAQNVEFALRLAVPAAVFLAFSRRVVDWRLSRPLVSVGLGVAVFAVWVGPDLLWSGYRHHWLFQNALMGHVRSSLGEVVRQDALGLAFRVGSSVLLVPVIEELFWRAWLMRWIILGDFHRVPLGTFTPASFWLVAALFASEHGPYWDVGFAAGVAYNWWMVRTRSLGDCILAHAVTNACLSAYVLATHKWEYWL